MFILQPQEEPVQNHCIHRMCGADHAENRHSRGYQESAISLNFWLQTGSVKCQLIPELYIRGDTVMRACRQCRIPAQAGQPSRNV